MNQGRRIAVQILTAAESLDERLVSGQMSHDAHLDLGVVGRHQALVIRSHGKGLADAHAFTVGRDVLQVGVRR